MTRNGTKTAATVTALTSAAAPAARLPDRLQIQTNASGTSNIG